MRGRRHESGTRAGCRTDPAPPLLAALPRLSPAPAGPTSTAGQGCPPRCPQLPPHHHLHTAAFIARARGNRNHRYMESSATRPRGPPPLQPLPLPTPLSPPVGAGISPCPASQRRTGDRGNCTVTATTSGPCSDLADVTRVTGECGEDMGVEATSRGGGVHGRNLRNSTGCPTWVSDSPIQGGDSSWAPSSDWGGRANSGHGGGCASSVPWWQGSGRAAPCR